MNAAVGLTAGLGLDGDRCIRVIPRHLVHIWHYISLTSVDRCLNKTYILAQPKRNALTTDSCLLKPNITVLDSDSEEEHKKKKKKRAKKHSYDSEDEKKVRLSFLQH